MPDYSKFYEARNIITDILFKDLVGPVTPNEILTELPTQYYIMGKLYPQSEAAEVIDLARNPLLENAIETYDASISLSNQKNPSSMGITCTLKAGVDTIVLSGAYAFYSPLNLEEAYGQGIDVSKWKTLEKKPDEIWSRKEYTFFKTVNLGEEKVEEPISLEKGIQLQVYTHNVFEDGERVITVAMVNTNQAGDDVIEKAGLCAFQPVLKIEGEDRSSIFTNANRQEQFATDEELLELDLLYSDINCYGQGHGCSVEWDTDSDDPLWVSSAWLPSYNLHQMMAAQIEDKQVLSMKYLSEAMPVAVIQSLRKFIQSYSDWINLKSEEAEGLDERFKYSADNNILKCRKAFQRMEGSIDLLEKSLTGSCDAIKAFQMANEAMLLQRRQTLLKAEKEFIPESVTWYPFQLAFILHELSSFIEPSGEERNIVDLLWFPTGGGKTEAYLGITAFVIFLRRIRKSTDDGVTVIMRYTLRLLTIQQFERASMLIFACELLRKKYHLGGSEISIGLWVGGKLTPNTLAEARTSINKQQRGAAISTDDSNPCQIQVCPWCGQKISESEYSVRSSDKRMIIQCKNENCDFHGASNGLPMHIIDEAIYEHLPTFIVATALRNDGICGGDLIILSRYSLNNPNNCLYMRPLSKAAGRMKTGNQIWRAKKTEVRFSTISGFKGLDSKVLVLIDVDGFTATQMRLLNYVAISRASSLLYVLYDCSKENERQTMILNSYTKLQ